jgi:hypothetical protein
MTIKVKVNNTWRTVADAKPPRLGDSFAGGIYIGKYDEEYYLVAAELKYHVNKSSAVDNINFFEKKTLMPWASTNAYYTCGASDSDNGQVNAQMIDTYIANNTRGLTYSNFPAANYIKNSMNAGTGVNGYTDWYIPSYQELLFIFQNAGWFHKFINNPIVYLDCSLGYWSSTEYSASVAYDTPYYLETYRHRHYWYRYGYYYEYFKNYWYSSYGITSVKNKNQGIIPVRRVDIF